MRILYVENHSVFAQITVKNFLSEHSVIVVPSISAAKENFGHSVFDVVLVDYDLDDAKGDELVRWIKQNTPDMPVIAVSARDEGNQSLMEAGANEICNKMEFDCIADLIARLVKI